MEQTTLFKIHNRILERNTEISITGESGRFKYLYQNNSDGSITCYGGKTGHAMYRSFMPNRVKRIHSKKKLR